jgi:hypothetical protein
MRKSKGKAVSKNALPLQFLAARRDYFLSSVGLTGVAGASGAFSVFAAEGAAFGAGFVGSLPQPTIMPKPNSKANAIVFIFSTLNRV